MKGSVTPQIEQLDIGLGTMFAPAAPVNEQALSAGRKNEIRQVVDGIARSGQHVLVFGAGGVGETSLANILATRLTSRSPNTGVIARRVNCDSRDDVSTVWRKVFSKIQDIQEKHQVGFTAGGSRGSPGETAVAARRAQFASGRCKTPTISSIAE
jgi:Cdc6-like AAA superfamily ATPase